MTAAEVVLTSRATPSEPKVIGSPLVSEPTLMVPLRLAASPAGVRSMLPPPENVTW